MPGKVTALLLMLLPSLGLCLTLTRGEATWGWPLMGLVAAGGIVGILLSLGLCPECASQPMGRAGGGVYNHDHA